MKAIALLAVAALAMPSALRRMEAPAGRADFTLTVERNGATWAATCRKGCAWREVRYACLAAPCRVTLDAHGIAGGEALPDGGAAFAFVLSPADNGWEASAIRGTAWTTLAWGCAVRVWCEARVDESGVTGSGPSR